MEKSKKEVVLGEGVGNEVKKEINKETSELLKEFVKIVFGYVKDKEKDIPEAFEHLLSSKKSEKEIVTLWTNKLASEGLIPMIYNGLTDKQVIESLHQEGYLEGLFLGYVLAMTAMVDNDVQKDKIVAVRDAIRPNLIGNRYDNRSEILNRYKDKKYSWVEKNSIKEDKQKNSRTVSKK